MLQRSNRRRQACICWWGRRAFTGGVRGMAVRQGSTASFDLHGGCDWRGLTMTVLVHVTSRGDWRARMWVLQKHWEALWRCCVRYVRAHSSVSCRLQHTHTFFFVQQTPPTTLSLPINSTHHNSHPSTRSHKPPRAHIHAAAAAASTRGAASCACARPTFHARPSLARASAAGARALQQVHAAEQGS